MVSSVAARMVPRPPIEERMRRTTTYGGLLALVATVLVLQACVGDIGDAPDSLDGAARPDSAVDARGRRSDGGTPHATPDAREIDGDGPATSDAGVTPEPDGSAPPPPPDGGSPDVATPPTSCAPPARQLRLLTRREYRNTVRDLLQLTDPAAPCAPQTFAYDAAGKKPTKVHVAGTFNNWAKTIADGGWPLQFANDKQIWTLS